METFKDIIQGEKPVLVDFFATWCGPCKMMSPIIDGVGKEMKGQIRTLKIDVDKNQALAAQLNIRSVPTFVMYKQGRIVWRHSGGMEKNSLLKIIKQNL